ncbi:Asp-tRNA(Asn)/Glu-tRNA(Gln) amidotransferase subunit GatB [Candidatus Magnetobacterium casense]|uniref:Aspartyl/glutamyl-tRNA(Asn/Gln) amidotransferase subunit B n=1 Tax=Candidatus Magnetobacterium casense TaxID=1455061 RepID=A0ABS6RZS6_9BACT|nr:Asp-tRNA(Asn)/Glu-tRNA(Gln) amidotransferase subunit GatB [Candidatus Magnetobacterium casensis]MBV6342119.1 Asp-tRNA(Asn)/Glu-tRNA(Gln) amidotransferase subunit GatB [Candidatus Magnetobacterium casensis]
MTKRDAATNYEVVIGLEIHAQMSTATKMFCGCTTRFGGQPNTHTCPVCIGMPGVLPVMNKRALEFTIRAGLATNCRIAPYSRFARKNYFYPDLPKGYQISQYELPICIGGSVVVTTEDGEKTIGITRIHMEEDAGKNIHEGSVHHSLVDLNRAGVPLMEIVTEPDIRSPREAAAFMRKLRGILRYLDVCDGNMEEGSLRCDANVSLRPYGTEVLGTKTEIKNINSFRFVEKALEYEIKRQEKVLKAGGTITQETRLWDVAASVTQSMRSKEEAHDYRYFPEPDLIPIAVSEEFIDTIRAAMPELPDTLKGRFIEVYNLPQYDADILTSDKQVAVFFEEAVRGGANPKAASNWIMGELMRLLNEKAVAFESLQLRPIDLVGLIKLIDDGTISVKIAKVVFEDMFTTGKSAQEVVKDRGLVQISDQGQLEQTIADIIAANPSETERYRAGEVKLMGFFVGEVMKATKGKANPKLVNEILRRKLS